MLELGFFPLIEITYLPLDILKFVNYFSLHLISFRAEGYPSVLDKKRE